MSQEPGTPDTMLLRAAGTSGGEVKSATGKMPWVLLPVLTIVMTLPAAGIMLSILLPRLGLMGSIQQWLSIQRGRYRRQ